ncbi:hypothetical protein [Curtobacterium sp. 'Ferrero']|uniref:hypothetical protein n=1 Tax=Curtobacterium sp. 'Ferrero' TaxID=2033654 RepID=UPI00114418A1|nr:hypothetical protein [Curtobacterium sp. 'Ferrero']
MMSTSRARAIGAVLGNPQPDPASLSGIPREPNVLVQFGDLETQLGIQAEPLAVFERQRGSSRIVTTFTHEADAERYLLISARPEIVPEPWDDAHVRYTWPDDVVVDDTKLNVSWDSDDGTHRMATTALGERKNLCLAAWSRDTPIEVLLARAART